MAAPKIINQEGIDKIEALFKRAESHLKNAEHLTDKVFIPAVNELRYAGYHLVRYLSGGDDDDLISSQKHCKRAIYDAAEGPLLKFLSDIAKFQNDYSKVACITEVIPDYIVHITKVQAARNLIADVQPDSREAYFDLVEPHLQTLKEIVGLLDIARVEINKRMRRDRNISLAIYGTLLVGIIAAIFTAIGPIQMSPQADLSATTAKILPPITTPLPASSVVPASP